MRAKLFRLFAFLFLMCAGVFAAVSGRVTIRGGVAGYANPRRGEKVSIVFTPPGSGVVKIKIYNLRWQLVWEKSVVASANAEKVVDWPAENSRGDVVSSGIYLVYVKGAGIEELKKAAVLK